MNGVRCLKCGSENLYHVENNYTNGASFPFYRCRSCYWWMYIEDYKTLIREASQKALEEALEES